MRFMVPSSYPLLKTERGNLYLTVNLGPLVRINPDEIHCSDFNFIDEIYAAGGRKRNKSDHQCRGSP